MNDYIQMNFKVGCIKKGRTESSLKESCIIPSDSGRSSFLEERTSNGCSSSGPRPEARSSTVSMSEWAISFVRLSLGSVRSRKRICQINRVKKLKIEDSF